MQESVAAAGPVPLDHFLAVAGHEKDSQTGPQLQCDFRKFASAEFRHHYVGKQQIDPAWIALTQSQTFEPIAGVDNNAAIGLEYRADQLADLDFVIDLQNDVALTGGNRSRPRSRISGGSCSCIFAFSGTAERTAVGNLIAKAVGRGVRARSEIENNLRHAHSA